MSSVSRIISSCVLSARVLRVRLLPFGHELSERLVGALRWDDVNLDQLITARARVVARYALAAQPQLRALLGTLRHFDVDRSVNCLDVHARAVQRLAERYRQCAQNVMPLALEAGVRPNRDFDICVPQLAVGAGQSLPLEAQHLTVADPGWYCYIERLAVRHPHHLARAVHRIEKVDLKRIPDVLRRHAEIAAFAAPTEEIGEDVVIEIGAAGAARPGRCSATAVAGARIGLGILTIEVPLRLTLVTRLVDLACVIALALVRIADDVIGRIDLLETIFRLWLAWIEIGMRFFSGLAVGLPDVVLASVGRDAQRLIGIGHESHV